MHDVEAHTKKVESSGSRKIYIHDLLRKTLFICILIFGILVAFYVFSKGVGRGYFEHLDFDTTVRIQDHMPSRFDDKWEGVIFLASPVISTAFVLIMTILYGLKLNQWKKITAIGIPIGFVFLVIAELFGKSIIPQRPPPFFMLKEATTSFPQFHVFETSSYPSGHAARSMYISILAFYFLLFFKRFKVLRIVAVGPVALYPLVVAVGKIYLGQHWLTDIIGGFIIASACAICVIGTERILR